MADFDWVSARFNCSSYEAWLRLRSQVESDVKTREQLRPKSELHSHYAFKFATDARSFHAFVEGRSIREEVSFAANEGQVVVSRNGKEIARATPTISDEGHCILKVGDKPYEFWQFRKLVLDDLLFHPYG